jgi:Secretory lipase
MAQRIGNLKPKGPVYISHNRWDPLIPYQAARQTGEDWCAMGTDVEFWTNEQPPLFNRLEVNNLLQPYVDGERSMAWVTVPVARSIALPTSSNISANGRQPAEFLVEGFRHADHPTA